MLLLLRKWLTDTSKNKNSKNDVAGAARAYIEALKTEPQHAIALAQYGQLAADKMKNPRVAEYLYRQVH